MLTLFISYGDISGLARAKGPFPTMSELPPILEDNMADKYLWMEARVSLCEDILPYVRMYVHQCKLTLV